MPAGASYDPNSWQFREANPNFGKGPITPQRAYQESIPQQAGDYDEIMQGYRDMMGGGNDPYGGLIQQYQTAIGSGKNKYDPVSYTEAPEWAQAFAKAKEFADSGGLSEAETGNLRARAISPIRSVYSNMTQNMDRQKRLQGGFSPNYNAAASRMAREGSEQIGQMTTNANAAIAEMQQKGRLAMAPEMAKLASGKNELMNQVALQNAANQGKYGDTQNQMLAGLRAALDSQGGRRNDALKGMTTLYGTNPALVETFGRQVQGQQQINNQATSDRARNRTAGLAASMR